MTSFLVPVMALALNASAAGASLQTLTIDASNKETFHYFALNDEGKLSEVKKEDPWIFSVRRYIFQTQTGPNGGYAGGAYAEDIAGFDGFSSCDGAKFQADENVSMMGYNITANTVLTGWFDYDDNGSLVPFPQFYAIGRDKECIKLKIESYAAGVYEIQYQQLSWNISRP